MNIKDKQWWKEFYLGELFTIIGSKTTPFNNLKKTKEIKYPYVTTQTSNNGQAGYYDTYTEKGNILVVDSACLGFCTFQANNFTASDHVEKLIPKFKINKYIALFLTTQINKNTLKKFSYGYKASQTRLKNIAILLPVNSNNAPDYEFMEEYMREKETKLKEQYKKYIQSHLSKKPIKLKQPQEWKEFEIDRIFTIKSGKRLTRENMQNGNIPFIGASDSNNGITNFIKNTNQSTDRNILGVNYNGSVVESFYHPYKCTFSDDVKRFSINNIHGNKYIYLYLKNIILKQKDKYMYGYKFNENRMKTQKIMLPVTSSGQPDYEYMENYIKSIEQKKILEYINYIDKKD